MKFVVVLIVISVLFVVSEGATTPKKAPPVGLYNLLPPFNETTISLEELLVDLPTTPGGRALIEKMVETISKTVGIPIPQSLIDAFLNNSQSILNYTALSINELSSGWTGANTLYWNGEIAQINTSFPKIPTYPSFIFPEQIDTTPFNQDDWIPTLTYLGDDLWWGFPFNNATSVEQVRINAVMSLLFNQLADNIHLPHSSPSYTYVSFQNNTYHSAHDFLAALLASGDYEITGYLEWHIAQFFGIYSNATSGPLKSVGDPVMQYTGIYNADHTQEAILPAAHSQWSFTVTNKKTNFYFDLEWYQGDTSYGFYPGQLYIYTPWSGRRTAKHMNGSKVVEAVKYMEYVKDVFVIAADKQNLYDGGYGVIGVCDDSCAIVEMMLGETTELYPFMIQKQLVIPELLHRIQKHDDHSELYMQMMIAVNALQEDWDGINSSSIMRANASIVWPDGQYPWQCVVDAQAIFASNHYSFVQ